MAVKDEIWRPEYDGRPPVAGPTSLDRVASPEVSAPDDSARHGWRIGAAAAAVGAMSLVVIIGPGRSGNDPHGAIDVFPSIDVIDDDRLQFSSPDVADFTDGGPLQVLESPTAPFVGTDPRRLPLNLVAQWTTKLAPLVADGGDNATTWVEAVDSRYVVVGIGDLRTLTGPAAVHVLDASTGDRLWTKQVESRIDQVDVVAAIDDVLVVTIGSEVVALDLASGSTVWSTLLTKVGASPQQIERLDGTDLLARNSDDSEGPIELVEPMTGAVVGEMIGEVLGSDREGRWYVVRGDKLLEFDLSGRSDAGLPDGESAVTVSSELVGAFDSERSRAAAVIAGSLVTTLDEMLAIGPLAADGERISGPGGLTPVTVDLGTPERLVLVRAIVPLGGSAFAIVGGGTVSGAEVVDGAIRFGWQRRGTVTASFTTERGVVLLLGTDGGSAQTLVDGATGDGIASLTMSPGMFDALEVVGNGIVTRRTSRDGLRIAGLDLDGNELWALDGSRPVSVGDGIVVRSTPQSDGSFEVTVYGDLG